jgi:hypothetical protein
MPSDSPDRSLATYPPTLSFFRRRPESQARKKHRRTTTSLQVASAAPKSPPLPGTLILFPKSISPLEQRSLPALRYKSPRLTSPPLSLIPATSAFYWLNLIKVLNRPGISSWECRLPGLWVRGLIWLSSTSSRFILDFFLLQMLGGEPKSSEDLCGSLK